MIMFAKVLQTERNRLLVSDLSNGQEVAVNAQCGCKFFDGEYIQIAYNGIMTMSIPPQISSQKIMVINANGDTITYLTEYGRILNNMIYSMTTAELTDSISQNFIAQMIPHHQAAVEMSENLLKYTDNPQLAGIAQDIIDEQTESIEQMQRISPVCGSITNTASDVQRYRRNVSQITAIMFSEMSRVRSDNCVNRNFLREMIPHHLGGIRMAENALKFIICPELNSVLTIIIRTQKRGIRIMQSLLQTKNKDCPKNDSPYIFDL